MRSSRGCSLADGPASTSRAAGPATSRYGWAPPPRGGLSGRGPPLHPVRSDLFPRTGHVLLRTHPAVGRAHGAHAHGGPVHASLARIISGMDSFNEVMPEAFGERPTGARPGPLVSLARSSPTKVEAVRPGWVTTMTSAPRRTTRQPPPLGRQLAPNPCSGPGPGPGPTRSLRERSPPGRSSCREIARRRDKRSLPRRRR